MSPPPSRPPSRPATPSSAGSPPALDAKPDDLSLKDGQVLVKGEAKMSWKDACRKLGMMPITGDRQVRAPGLSLGRRRRLPVRRGHGRHRDRRRQAQEDRRDPGLGLIIDKLTWESQVYGGVIGGLNYGLFEERVMDPITGVMLNPDMELYKLAGASDIPEIVVKAYEPHEMKARGRDRRRRAADDLHRRRDRQRRDQRHRRPRPRMADVPPERPQRPGHGLQRREGVTR